jgi:anti-sigma factor RsiW
MGAALRVSRNNPAPNTKMVALRKAAGTLCIQLRDVIGEIAPSTAGAGGCCAGAVINAGYVIRQLENFVFAKNRVLDQPPIRRCLWPDKEKAPAR